MASASIAGIIMAAISAVTSTTLSVRASNAQEAITKHAARVKREQASAEEMRVRRQSSIELGRQRAVLGKLGILPTAGSPLEQLARNAGEAERAAVLTRGGLLNEASMLDAQARSISSQKGLLAASNALSGLASASQYASPLLQRNPPPGNQAGQPYARPGLA